MAVADRIDDELAKLYIDTGIDLSSLPDIMTADQLASAVQKTVDALATEMARQGFPFAQAEPRTVRA